MKYIASTLVILIALSLGSCFWKKKKAPQPTKENTSIIIGDPMDCGIDSMVIFPTGTSYLPTKEEKKRESERENNEGILSFKTNNSKESYHDKRAMVEYINNNENEFDIRNILFHDLNTGISYPLLHDTAHILSFALHREFTHAQIFYRIVKKDHNNDDIYNSEDPVILYTSDLNGKNLIQVTPDDEKFVDYFYYPKTQKILVKSIIDRNDDKIFTNSDETNFRELNIKEPAMGREIFSKSLKDSLRIQ
jgi:hypothetical protein